MSESKVQPQSIAIEHQLTVLVLCFSLSLAPCTGQPKKVGSTPAAVKTAVAVGTAPATGSSPSAGSAPQTPPTPPTPTRDKTLSALKAELKRSFDFLQKAKPSAYFIAYRMYAKDSTNISASGGALDTLTKHEYKHSLQVEVRVGTPELDNFHPLKEDTHSDEISKKDILIPAIALFDCADEKVLRANIWVATENAYRKAAQRYGRVLAQKGLATEQEHCPDFSKEKPTVEIDPEVSKPESLDVQPLVEEARALSKIYSKFNDIEESDVQFKIERARRYLVNSEGTQVVDKVTRIQVETSASATAPDGEKVSRIEDLYYADIPQLFKNRGKLEAFITKVATTISALRAAPLAEPFGGPIILGGEAAAVLFHEVLGHRLESSRHRNITDGGTFDKMLNHKILPQFISVFDRPLTRSLNGIGLSGSYRVDDDGVKAQNVTLVDKGRLNAFLVSRVPAASFVHSNGHGRCDGAEDSLPESRMANLIVESSKAVSEAQLRNRLIAEAKKQKRPYGLFIESVESGTTETSSNSAQVFEMNPSLVKRVYTDGRPDQLVRGLRIVGTPMSALQRIICTSDRTQVFNGYCGSDSGWVPQANCCPAILFDYLETERKPRDKGIARILPAPTEAPVDKNTSSMQAASLRSNSVSDSPATTDSVLRAMSDELARSMAHLKMDKKAAPYYEDFEIGDLRTDDISYQLGECYDRSDEHKRVAAAEVRVGDYQFDNTKQLTNSQEYSSVETRSLPLDGNYLGTRRQLWLLADDAYKEANQRYDESLSYRRGHVPRHPCESFSKEPANLKVLPPPAQPGSLDGLHRRIRDLSFIFSKYPKIICSFVIAQRFCLTSYIASSEGTSVRVSQHPIEISVVGYSRTADGVNIWDMDFLRAENEDELPDQIELEKRVAKFAQGLTDECAAERRDYYYGPVLFEDQAASELLMHAVAPMLCTAIGDNVNPSKSLLRSLNMRVLPDFINIADDVTLTKYHGQPLGDLGPVDGDGLTVQKVQLVEHGFLKTLLSGRRPVFPGQHSNGHQFGDVTPTTLILDADEGKTTAKAAMKEKLIQLAKARGLKEALIIRRIKPMTPTVLSGGPVDMRGDTIAGSNPVGMYTVDVDTGVEHRVRGLAFTDFGRSAMDSIVAVGDDAYAHTTTCWNGNLRNVISPSLLVDNLELEEDTSPPLSPYQLPNPYFNN